MVRAMSRTRAYRALSEADPVIGNLVERYGKPDPFQFPDGGRTQGSNFAVMTLHIVAQQISMKVALVLYDRLVEALGGKPTPEGVLALGADRIKSLGTSRAKSTYLVDLAEHIHTGALDIENLEQFSDQRAVDALVAVKGVGQWTAEMFLIHQLRRPDVLPAGDLGIRHAIAAAYRLEVAPTIDEARARSAAWAPYRTYASAILWRSLADGAHTARGSSRKV